MAHRRGSFRRGVSQSQRRKKLWAAFSSEAIGVDLSVEGLPSGILNFQTTPNNAVGEFSTSLGYVFPSGKSAGQIDPESTILRIRGTLELQKNTVDVGSTPPVAGEENVQFAFGIGVMESSAANLGAFPNPALPSGSDWDGWMFYRSQNQGALDANAGIVDVKAMRKIQSGYTLFFVMGLHAVAYDSTTVTTAVGLAGFFQGRGLCLLP